MYKVLIIEDEDLIREGLKYMMDWAELECIVVDEASNGVEGLDKIADIEPDIVLLDVNMPLKNGIEMLETCNDQYIFSTIIISGYDEFEYAKRAMEFGVTEYLLKPVDHNELKKAVDKAKTAIDRKKEYHIMQESITTPQDINVLNLEAWKSTNSKSEHVKEMVAYIQENYDEKISIHDLVYQLGRSTTYLNKKFKDKTSFTFNEFLNRYRIQQSIERIKIGNEKISMIALDVGFSNYRYFIKVFKHHTGMLPSDFMEFFHHK